MIKKLNIQQFIQKCAPIEQNIYYDIQKYYKAYDTIQDYDFPTLKLNKRITQSNVCAKILTKKLKAFKCHDCMYQVNSIICVQCFEGGDHTGHIYQLVQVFGGCCDCGDQEKWNPKGSCKKHQDTKIVQTMKKQIIPQQQKDFQIKIKFCLFYLFYLYNRANLQLIDKQKIHTFAQNYGIELINYLIQFNKQSLISNIMTYNVLIQQYDSLPLQFIFKDQSQNHLRYFQIILKLVQYDKFAQKIIDFYIQIMALRQFRKQLTISYLNMYSNSFQFSKSGFNHLSCQLLTSHKVIKQIVQQRKIGPLILKPKSTLEFKILAQTYVKYYIDIEYLSKLYDHSSEIYFNYFIQQNGLTYLGQYRKYTSQKNQAINYYGIQQIYLSKIIKILNVIKDSQECIQTLQKGIIGMFESICQLYKYIQIDLKYEQMEEKTYITQQITLAFLIFVYFQKLQQKGQFISEDKQMQKYQKIIKILNLNNRKDSKQIIKKMLYLLNNFICIAGLTLGLPQIMQRYYTFFSFLFRRSLMIPSLCFYLYKLVVQIWKQLNKIQYNNTKMIIQQSVENKQYLKNSQDLFTFFIQDIQQELTNLFLQNSESIYDRKKKIIKLTCFLVLIIQLSETDIHELIIAVNMNLYKKPKYQQKIMKFYEALLQNYKKIGLKQFKAITDSFFVCDQLFQQFLASSKNIQIKGGKISLINKQNQILQSNKQQQADKIQSNLNLYYFKSFKHKLINIEQKNIVLKTPQSQNHFLFDIISTQILSRLIKLAYDYFGKIYESGQKVKQQQSVGLGQLLIEIIKINRALCYQQKNPSNKQVHLFLNKLKNNKKYLEIFNQSLIKIICYQADYQQMSAWQEQRIKQKKKHQQARNLKFQNKKMKKLAKFKQNQQIFDQKYTVQLSKIRQQIQDQQQKTKKLQNSENIQQQQQICMTCRQSNSLSQLMLTGYIQISDLYYQLYQHKQPQKINNNLIFKTCNHFIHQQCFLKINGSKQYSLCLLCKKTVNCLFPLNNQKSIQQNSNELQIKQEQKQKQNFKYKIYNLFQKIQVLGVILIQNCSNGFGKKIQDQRNIIQKVIDSFIKCTVMSLFNQFQQSKVEINKNQSFFIKYQLPAYQSLLKCIKFLIDKYSKNDFMNIFLNFQIWGKQIQRYFNYFIEKINKNQQINNQFQIVSSKMQNKLVQNQIQIQSQQQLNNQIIKNQQVELIQPNFQNISKKQKIINLIQFYIKILVFNYLVNNQQILIELNQKYKKLLPNEIINKINNIFKCFQKQKQFKAQIIQIQNNQIKNKQNIIKQTKQKSYIQVQNQKEQKIDNQNVNYTQNSTNLMQIQEKNKQFQTNKKMSEQQQQLLLQQLLLQSFTYQQYQNIKIEQKFFKAPKTLQKLFEYRGKCPNCLKYSHHIFICILCQWKSCKQCSVQKIAKHNDNKHYGNSIYIQADIGNIYYISRRKYWIFPSIYQDYLGSCLNSYTTGIKLDKYTLNQKKYKQIIKDIMQFNIENKIRYNQYYKKRTLNQNLLFGQQENI